MRWPGRIRTAAKSLLGRGLRLSLIAALALVTSTTPLGTPVAFADSQGPNSPDTGANDTSTGTLAWTNPGNVLVSDNVEAQAGFTASGEVSNYLTATDFDFSIPSTATIGGIVVESEKSASGLGQVTDIRARIIKGGTIGSTDRSLAGAWFVETTFTYGSSSDLWGESWSPSNINATNFGFAISATANSVIGSVTGGVDHIKITVHYTVPSTYTQSAYRWYANADSTDVGSPLANQDTSATLAAQGTPFRLRMLVHVADATLATSGENFKLQFARKGSGSCASPSDAYADVTGSSAMRYHDNASPADGAALTANGDDPTHSGHPIQNQTYEESNNFTNSQAAIAAGEDGKWDFALIDTGATGGTTYCFRAVKSDGTAFSTYSVYPEITTGGLSTTFDIVDSGGSAVANPSYSMSTKTLSFECQTSTGTFAESAQRVRVSNNSIAEDWTLDLAATGGVTSFWDGSSSDYDFNDTSGSPAGCGDGGDADSLAGALTLNPAAGTIAPKDGCASTGISKGSSATYTQGSIDAVTVLTGTDASNTNCYWDFTGASLSQQIPGGQAPGSYSINMTLTLTVT